MPRARCDALRKHGGSIVTAMKPALTRLSEARSRRAETAISQYIGGLFERLPMLCGFSVSEDLELAEIAVDTWPGLTVGKEFYDEFAAAFNALTEERPEAVELLRGRTFARTLH
jgi:hypothetical protein